MDYLTENNLNFKSKFPISMKKGMRNIRKL